MGGGGGEAAREALAATVATALRQHARHSAHPADQAALGCAAARIALALQAEFIVVCRHSSAAELIGQQQTADEVHE